MADYVYQTVQVENRSPISGSPSIHSQAVTAGIKLFAKMSVALNGWAVAYRVNQELEKLKPEIALQMPHEGGVLVCVGIQEWKNPDPVGNRAQMFLSIHIAGAGPNPQSVLQKYLGMDRMVAGTPEGWRRKDAFIWVTPDRL